MQCNINVKRESIQVYTQFFKARSFDLNSPTYCINRLGSFWLSTPASTFSSVQLFSNAKSAVFFHLISTNSSSLYSISCVPKPHVSYIYNHHSFMMWWNSGSWYVLEWELLRCFRSTSFSKNICKCIQSSALRTKQICNCRQIIGNAEPDSDFARSKTIGLWGPLKNSWKGNLRAIQVFVFTPISWFFWIPLK